MPIHYKWIFVLVILILVLGIPRFNRQDILGIDNFSSGGKRLGVEHNDAGFYIDHVRYFRGEVDADALELPWAYRPLSPYLASFLPFPALTSINIVNYIALITGLLYLLKILAILQFRPKTVLLGGGLYTFSFPVFYYGTIGYVDPLILAFLMASFYSILSRNWIGFIALTILAAAAKETYVIIFPVLFCYLWLMEKKPLIKNFGITIILASLFIATLFFIRTYITPLDSNYYWIFESERFNRNFFRINSWISLVLALGPTGLLALHYWFQRGKDSFNETLTLTLTIGFLSALAVFIFSIFSAYTDGRYIWLGYPFLIPLACLDIESFWLGNKKK